MNPFKNIAYDKKLHLAAGFIISLSSAFIGVFGLLAALMAGVAKEIYDYIDYGKYDPLDMEATWMGGIIGFVLVMAIKWLI